MRLPIPQYYNQGIYNVGGDLSGDIDKVNTSASRPEVSESFSFGEGLWDNAVTQGVS